MPEQTRTYAGHIQEQTKSKDHRERRIRIREAIKECSRALARGSRQDYYAVACLSRDILVPLLINKTDYTLTQYHQAIEPNPEWHYTDLKQFIDRPDAYTEEFAKSNGHGNHTRDLILSLQGNKTESAVSMERVRNAFYSLTEIAEFRNIISDELTNHVTANGFATQIGKMWKKFDWDLGDEIQIIYQSNAQWPKTLYCGGTGSGKSASMGTEVADSYNAGFKIIDLIDTDDWENCVFDIPQHNGTIDPDSANLRRVREDMDAPPDFRESDELKNPKQEILVPLTESINDYGWPHADGECKVTPFTIPASEIDKATLVSFISAMVSRQQETSIRTAYDNVARSGYDWTLKELAGEIAQRDDIEGTYRKRIVNLLKSVQDVGFVRDKADDHAIDWERIFYDTDTITSFSVAHMGDQNRQLMVLSYLVRSVYHKRKDISSKSGNDDLPPATAVLREIHEIVPHQNETTGDRRGEQLQYAIANNLSYILRKNRHQRLEIKADTQDLMDVKKGVRKRFNRYVVFKLPDDSLRKVFQYAGESKFQQCRDSIGVEPGTGAVVGLTGPNAKDGIPFLSPIQFKPAPHHVVHVDEENTGFEARCRYLDETMKRTDFDANTPEDLLMNVEEIMAKGEAVKTANDPMGAFYRRFIDDEHENKGDRHKESAPWVHQKVVRAVYNRWANEVGFEQIESEVSFGMRLSNYAEYETQDRKEKSAMVGLTLKHTAKEFLPSEFVDQ